MSIFEAIILGLVQGLTEFIPVSSSGHLVLIEHLFSGRSDHLFIQALDIGTTLALIIYFWPRIMELLRKVFKDHDYRLARNIIITVLPAGILGFLLSNFIEDSQALVSPLVVAIMLALVGVLMVVVDRLPKKSARETGTDLSPKRALVIGLAQSFALIPGVSRSGSTIVAGRIMGLGSKAAAEYSFMVSIPIMLGLIAKLLLSSHDRTYLLSHWPSVFVANLVAFVSSLVAIHFLLSYLSRHGLSLFGWYRLGLAAVVITVLLVQ